MNVTFTVEDRDGSRQQVELPTDMSLNLMEGLKACEYHVLATCGGMALCATCHVEILEGMEQLPPITDAEIEMLDTLPDATSKSRLACQLSVDQSLQNVVLAIRGEE